MPAWRVTYLEYSYKGQRRVSVTIHDPEGPSLDRFVARLSSGALGPEWTRGRIVQSVRAVQPFRQRHPGLFESMVVAAVVSVAILLVGFVIPFPHDWSYTIYATQAGCSFCQDPGVSESFPRGSLVSGGWSASSPIAMTIVDSQGDLICPVGSSQNGSGSCSQTWARDGSFEFTAVGGNVSFIPLSDGPVNYTVSGSWSGVLL